MIHKLLAWCLLSITCLAFVYALILAYDISVAVAVLATR